MFTVALFGAGKIGDAIVALLAASGDYRVRICDTDVTRAQAIAGSLSCCDSHLLNLDDKSSTLALLKGCDAVISALPFFCNRSVALYAAEAGVHYFDLTEDVETTKFISSLATNSKSCFVPQCGLAPGFISLAARSLISEFNTVDTVKMRVGALPVFPTNRLKYNLTWSTDGLINEYCNPCEVIVGGTRISVPALEDLESFVIDGEVYEAFNTSGGLGTLCDTLQGQVRNLNYKSIRYPGHRDLLSFLLNELRFIDDRAALKKVFERSIPITAEDKCVILVEVTGVIHGRFIQKTYASTVYHQTVGNRHFAAIQITTASGILGIVDILVTGGLKGVSGMVKAESIPLETFLKNRFGKYYA